jgi:hypothetical protein
VAQSGALGAARGITALNKFKMPTMDQAEQASDANKQFGLQELIKGHLTIIGEQAALVRGTVNLTGLRDGIDGLYSIQQVEHSYSRTGFTTALELRNPVKAGEDTSTPDTGGGGSTP